MNRRHFLASAATLAATVSLPSILQAQSKPARPATTQATLPDNLVWHDVREWGLEGRGFDDTENYFDRLPARAKGAVRPEVWALSRNTAGMSARFDSNAETIYVRYELTSANLAMPHMPATGVSGVDLYAQADGQWRWLATHFPNAQSTAGQLGPRLDAAKRSFLVNLPLYNGIKSLEIGVAKDAEFSPVSPRAQKPILIYGTSITQGGCASRPGMAFPAILGRRLDVPTLNFGFSGNGRMEIEVARFFAELDPAIFVLDCMANMGSQPITPRTIEVIKHLRQKRANTPILLVGERLYDDWPINSERRRSYDERAAALQAAYAACVADGVTNFHFRRGDDLLGNDNEATVDGSHPNDLGMMRYADALEPVLRKLMA